MRIVLSLKELTIFGYENEIIQVLLNMINNAYEILCERNISPKIVLLETYKKDNKIMFSVHDNGNGIPNNLKDKVFEPYFTTKHQKQGVGIGLYMSYELISLHMDGEITVENEYFTYEKEKYYGAKFEIIIPQKD